MTLSRHSGAVAALSGSRSLTALITSAYNPHLMIS
jgi:hypothetical protein